MQSRAIDRRRLIDEAFDFPGRFSAVADVVLEVGVLG